MLGSHSVELGSVLGSGERPREGALVLSSTVLGLVVCFSSTFSTTCMKDTNDAWAVNSSIVCAVRISHSFKLMKKFSVV